MHVPLNERVEAWFAAAESDLAVADMVCDRVPHTACFHAQQSAEKALKALVTRLAGDAPQVHAIARIFAAIVALGTTIPSAIRDSGEALDKFYIPTRYPDALGYVDAALAYKRRDADGAISDARAVLAWARASERAIR